MAAVRMGVQALVGEATRGAASLGSRARGVETPARATAGAIR